MALQKSKPTSADNGPVEDGLYPARCVRIIEIGDQEDKYGVKSRVVFGFIVPSLKIEIDGEEKSRMFMTFPQNNTDNPDSTVAGYIKALGGSMEDPVKAWETVIDKPCTIELSTVTKKGVDHTNITNVVRPMAGVTVPEADCDVFIFDFENPEKEVLDKLSEYRIGQIKDAVNYPGSKVEAMLDGKRSSDEGQSGAESEEDSPI